MDERNKSRLEQTQAVVQAPREHSAAKEDATKHLPYTKTRISTIPLHAHPESDEPKKKKKPKRKRKIFSFSREDKEAKNPYDKDEVLLGTIKTTALLVITIVIGCVLAFLFMRGVMDIFALGKSDHPVKVQIEEYSGINDIADVLYEKQVIRYPTLFRLWAVLKKQTNRNFEAGEYVVSPAMNYDDLLDVFVPSEYKRTEITIKIPEGSSVDDIIDIFLANGIGTREGFEEVINHHEFDTEQYWFLQEIPEEDPYRIWRLEGFLYPDTYYFYSDSSELAAITKLLDRFGQMFKKGYMNNCAEQGMTLMEALTLGSLITKETLNDVDYKPVSQVFANRLASPDFGYLEIDSPLHYLIRHQEGAYRELTDADKELASPYNLYATPGLPPSPVCSPTISTIQAALYPSATEQYPDAAEYYYFLLTVSEYCAYAKTREEYEALVAKDLLDRENAVIGDLPAGDDSDDDWVDDDLQGGAQLPPEEEAA